MPVPNVTNVTTVVRTKSSVFSEGLASALLAIGLTVLLWASAFPGIRAALVAFSPTELATLRFMVAASALGVFALVARPGLPHTSDLPMIAVSGGIGISLYNLALNTGELTVSASTASFIINTVPIFTALLAFFFLHEHLNRWGWIGIAISFAGVTLLAVGEKKGFHFSAGAAFVLAAAILQALYFVLQKPLLTRYRPIQLTTYVVWAGTLFLLPFAPAALTTARHAPLGALLAAVYLGVFPGAVAYVAWNYALSHYPAARAAGFLYLVPPIATVIGFIWLREVPSSVGFLGGAIALTGVAVLTFGGKADRTRQLVSRKR